MGILRKSLALIMLVTMLATLSACGKDEKDKSLPEGMSQELYDTGKNVLKIMDKYNDADITADEAETRLDALYNKIEKMDLSDDPNKNEIWSEYERALTIRTAITSYNHALLFSNNSSSDTYTIADELRETLELD